MQKVFLASLFKDVSQIFIDSIDEKLAGKTVTFIPTAALPDKLDFHIKYSKELLTEMGLVVDELEISTATHSDIVKKLKNNDYIIKKFKNNEMLELLNGTKNIIVDIRQIDDNNKDWDIFA